MKLVKEVYILTRRFPREKLYGLSSQLRRAAFSIPLNIAEGSTRISSKEYAHFLTLARSSSAEVETTLLLSLHLGYANEGTIDPLLREADEISRMLYAIRSKLS